MRLVQTMKSIGIAAVLAGTVMTGCSGGSSAESSESTQSDSSVDVPDETSVAVSATTEPPLFDFSAQDSANGWNVVNDTVMGGVSSGRLVVDDGLMVFDGELSLDNNGGFASVRSPVIDPDFAAAWSGRSGTRIVVEGDGRTWTVEVRTADVDGGWIASLPTTSGSKAEVVVPWTTFEPVTRFLDPRVAEGPLDPRRIVSIAFYLVDGIEGSFRLAISSIS